MCRPSRRSNKQTPWKSRRANPAFPFSQARDPPTPPSPTSGTGAGARPSPQATKPHSPGSSPLPEIAFTTPPNKNITTGQAPASASSSQTSEIQLTHPTKPASGMTDMETKTHTHPTQIPLRVVHHNTLGPGTWIPPSRSQGPLLLPIPEVPTNFHQLRCLATPQLLPTEHDLLPPSTIITHLPLAITISIPSIAGPPHGTGFCRARLMESKKLQTLGGHTRNIPLHPGLSPHSRLFGLDHDAHARLHAIGISPTSIECLVLDHDIDRDVGTGTWLIRTGMSLVLALAIGSSPLARHLTGTGDAE